MNDLKRVTDEDVLVRARLKEETELASRMKSSYDRETSVCILCSTVQASPEASTEHLKDVYVHLIFVRAISDTKPRLAMGLLTMMRVTSSSVKSRSRCSRNASLSRNGLFQQPTSVLRNKKVPTSLDIGEAWSSRVTFVKPIYLCRCSAPVARYD